MSEQLSILSKSLRPFYFYLIMKKIFTLILLSMITFNAIHAEVTWTLSEDGTLTISGTGDMDNYDWQTLIWDYLPYLLIIVGLGIAVKLILTRKN